ncbi:MAG: phosphatase PAP2 family protein [Thermoanaerobacterales bacterium]|jgi:undecaprenyl-diphosphatase|nr:phosphatase PAP2 family protein [Thermoanaerobacterales bacterium]
MKGFLNYLYMSDKNVFIYLNKRLRCRVLDVLMPKITHLGGGTFAVFSCILLYVFGQGEMRIAAAEAIITVTGSQGIVQLFKNLIYRKRPYMVIPDVNTFWKRLLKDYSFPSGHTTAGFSLAVALGLNFPSYSLLSYFVATMIGFSRIYTGMHYPSDVISGALLGAVFAFLTHAARGLFV